MSAAIAGLAIAAGTTAYTVAQSEKTKRDAKKALEEQDANRPDVGLPSAFQELRAEPISEQFRKSRDELAQRRTAQSVGAAAKGGARTLLGALGNTLDRERQLENQRYGELDQARINVLGTVGNADERVIGRKQDIWNQQTRGMQAARVEGVENMFSGLNNLAQMGMYADEKGLFKTT